MMFDHRKLEGRIVERFGTRSAFADAAGVSKTWLSMRLTGKLYFDTDDIIRFCSPELLDIPATEVHVYFFTPLFR